MFNSILGVLGMNLQNLYLHINLNSIFLVSLLNICNFNWNLVEVSVLDVDWSSSFIWIFFLHV